MIINNNNTYENISVMRTTTKIIIITIINCTLRGEIGASLMKRRIITGRIQCNMKVLNGKNELLKKILELMTSKQIVWTMITDKYMELIGITNRELIETTKEKLKERTKGWDLRLWIEEVSSNTSLNLYMERKKENKEEQVYNNRPSSIILYKARTNCLPLNDRKRFTGENTTCILCDGTTETLEHFILEQARRQLNWNGGGGMDSQYIVLSELLSDQAAFITSPKTSMANYWGALPPCPPVSTGL